MNHIGYHKGDRSYDSIRYESETQSLSVLLSKSNGMRDHRLSDTLCLNYQRSFFQRNSARYQPVRSLIHSMFGHVSPWRRFWRWIGRKSSVRRCDHHRNGPVHFLGVNVQRLLLTLYGISRVISVFLTVNICNLFLFSYSIDAGHDNVAVGVMRIIGICYILMLLIWMYYVIMLYSIENLVGFIVDAKCRSPAFDVVIQDQVQNAQQFRDIMKINQTISQCVELPEIATLISLYLFYPSFLSP